MTRFATSFTALAAVVAATFVLAGPAQSQAEPKPSFHPTKTVTIVVPYSPGGGTDAVGRLMAKELEAMWGQTVIIDNRTGGNGSVGAALVARAQPDGHTMVLAVSGIAINAHLLKLPYDTATAFAPVTAVAYPVATLLATPTLPANDLKELKELVGKEGPDKRTFASPDPGSRLIAERVFEKAGIKLMNIPYKGAASFVGDIAAGRVDVGIASVTSGLALLNAGRLKSLGIVGTQRIPALPQVATFKEQGFAGTRREFLGRPVRAGRHAGAGRRGHPAGHRPGPGDARSSRPSWSTTARCRAASRRPPSPRASSAISGNPARRSSASA